MNVKQKPSKTRQKERDKPLKGIIACQIISFMSVTALQSAGCIFCITKDSNSRSSDL